jgi:RND family efflux transporter MFP subunit
MRAPRRRKTLSVLLAAGLASVLASCGEAPKAPEIIRPVKAMMVEAPVTERTLTYSGTLAPRIESTLGFRVAGKVVERFVNAGNEVKKGQKIARLDETDLKLAENSARASLAAARTRMAVAKDALDRANSLITNDFISRSTVDQRKLDFDSAKAAFDAAQDQLNQAVNATSYALLLADKDGIVTSVRAEPGQVVSAGQAIITFALAGDIEAAVYVPEQEIAQFKVGDPATVSLWSADNIKADGKIREIAGAADPASRTYAVRVSLDRENPRMRLGMTAAVQLRARIEKPAFVVPIASLTDAAGGKAVFVANAADSTVSSRKVTVTGLTDDGAKISEGLNPGDIVVTGGVQFLRDGMKVRLPSSVMPAVAASR